jgi:spore coat protein U-like protein
VTVSCSGAQAESVSFSLSLAVVATRNGTHSMKARGHSLQYGLFLDSARTQLWGDGTAGTSVIKGSFALSNGHASQDYAVYGRMPGGQSEADAGAYNDTQVLSLTW